VCVCVRVCVRARVYVYTKQFLQNIRSWQLVIKAHCKSEKEFNVRIMAFDKQGRKVKPSTSDMRRNNPHETKVYALQ
jgi:hypothetical protein